LNATLTEHFKLCQGSRCRFSNAAISLDKAPGYHAKTYAVKNNLRQRMNEDQAKKKIINNPKNVLPEMMEGYLGVYGDIIKQVENHTSVVRKNRSPNTVGLIIGGGSGHEPLFMDYIGLGYAAGVAQGNIFAAPSPDNILAVTKAVDQGKGVI
jgi:hypothetical protein